MNMLRLISLLAVLFMALMAAGSVKAQGQCPLGDPPTPHQVAEINGTHGAALLAYCPQYAIYLIPTTGADYYHRHHHPPAGDVLTEIQQTRGQALMEYWQK